MGHDQKKKETNNKEHTEILKEIDSLLNKQNNKETDSFIKERGIEKRKKPWGKISRWRRVLIATIFYLLFAVPVFFLLILPSINTMPLTSFLILGYIGFLLLVYFLAEWIYLNRKKKVENV